MTSSSTGAQAQTKHSEVGSRQCLRGLIVPGSMNTLGVISHGLLREEAVALLQGVDHLGGCGLALAGQRIAAIMAS